MHEVRIGSAGRFLMKDRSDDGLDVTPCFRILQK
jgi:hypothetical protein